MEYDRLKEQWDQQVAFMRLLQEKRGFPEFPVDITSKPGQKLLQDISHHMMTELFEACQHLKNSKSHRITEITHINREEFKEELVDSLHLFYEMCIAAGLTADELHEAYMKKGQINVERIMGGY